MKKCLLRGETLVLTGMYEIIPDISGMCGGSRVGGGVLSPKIWIKCAMNSNFMTSLIH